MHLMYTLDTEGKRVYTLKKINDSQVTKSAHPARFSPDDKYSRHRVTIKKRYGLLLTQQISEDSETLQQTGNLKLPYREKTASPTILKAGSTLQDENMEDGQRGHVKTSRKHTRGKEEQQKRKRSKKDLSGV